MSIQDVLVHRVLGWLFTLSFLPLCVPGAAPARTWLFLLPAVLFGGRLAYIVTEQSRNQSGG